MLDARARARFASNRSAVLGAALVGALVAFSLFGPLVARHDPFESDFARGVSADGMPVGPGRLFPLGADRLFRDVFARLACAGRLSLVISVCATALASCLGAAVGLTAGWFERRPVRAPWPVLAGVGAGLAALASGRPGLAAVAAGAGVLALAARRRFAGPRLDLDGALMRLVDALLAFPFLLLVMSVGAALERTSAVTILLTLGATGWLGTARVLRAKTLQVRSLDYVLASRALGHSAVNVVLRHVLPNVVGPLVVTSTMQVAQMIVAESALAYLGVGVALPTPTWGRMLFEGQEAGLAAPWLIAAPAAAISLSVWGFNLLGEGLRDALDPNDA